MRNSKNTLSVLIPVFNWDITMLVNRLYSELHEDGLNDSVEIVILDDSSSNCDIKDHNRTVMKRFEGTMTYKELDQNIGRSAIRNLLVQESSGEYVLFLDADVLPDSDSFLSNYYSFAAQGKHDVVCGGVSYKTRILHGAQYDFYMYFYGEKGTKMADERNMAPWRQLLTSNTMVRRETLKKCPLDESFTGYGYEDNEWGIRLMHVCSVLHIDNQVSHLGIQSKNELYKKMRESIKGYFLLAKKHPDVFYNTPIARLMRLLSFFPMKLLDIGDHVLGCLYFKVSNNWALHKLFQLNKLILMTIEAKKAAKGEVNVV